MLTSRNFLVIASINFLVMTAYYLLFVVSGPYAVANFDVSPSLGGLVAGIMLIGCLAGRFVTGRLIEIFGFRPVLLVATGIYIGGIALYLVAGTLPFLLLVRFVSGLGVGGIGTVSGTLVAHIIPRELHGRGVSYFSLSTILAMALGPFLGISLMRWTDYDTIFVLCLCLGVAALFLSFCISYPATGANASSSPSKGFSLDTYLERSVMPLALVTLVISACYGSVQAFLPLYAEKLQLVGPASFFFLFYAAVALVSRPMSGRLFDTRGANIIVYPALALTGLGLVALSFSTSPILLFLSGSLLGAGVGNMQTIAQAISLKLVSHERYGQATSTHFIFLDFGIGFGPYCMGFLIPSLGYSGMYFVAAIAAFLCFPLYWFVHGRKNT